MLLAVLLLVAGLVVLVACAEVLVRGASGIALKLGIPPLVVGLTIVAFGTSSPELAVSLGAVADGRPDLALGNAIGSNTFNVLFILGLSALIRPLIVHQKLIRIDVPLMIGVSAALWLMSLDGLLGRIDGALLLLGIVAYTAMAIRSARREPPEVHAEYAEGVPASPSRSLFKPIALVVFGLCGTVLGSRLLVQGAVAIAQSLGVSELIIGLTIVAAGTSLPEVATSVLATIRGQRDIAVGNVIGSNLFNILAILGLAGLVAPQGLAVSPSLLGFDLPVMLAASAVCLPIFFTGGQISRWEGGLLLSGYLAYTAYLVLDASGHAAREGFSQVALLFVLPLAALAITGSVAASLRRRNTRH